MVFIDSSASVTLRVTRASLPCTAIFQIMHLLWAICLGCKNVIWHQKLLYSIFCTALLHQMDNSTVWITTKTQRGRVKVDLNKLHRSEPSPPPLAVPQSATPKANCTILSESYLLVLQPIFDCYSLHVDIVFTFGLSKQQRRSKDFSF